MKYGAAAKKAVGRAAAPLLRRGSHRAPRVGAGAAGDVALSRGPQIDPAP